MIFLNVYISSELPPAKHILAKDNSIPENAILGTKPYVFMATSEDICGKSLSEIYLNIAYMSQNSNKENS